jgi:hypothetical protein
MRAYINQERFYWLVNRYASEFQRGDQVLMWESGANGGIVAYGVVVELPVARHNVLMPADLGDAFWHGDKPDDGAVVVGVRVLATAANGFFVSKTAMKQKIFGYIAMEINRLTDDEDLRQDLWLFFLEGNSPFLFKEYIDSIDQNDYKYGVKQWHSKEILTMMRKSA